MIFHFSDTFRKQLPYVIHLGIFVALIVSTLIPYLTIVFATNDLIMPNGQVLGGDFSCFYIAGKIARENIARLYDWPYGYELRKAFLNDPTGKYGALPYAYPPFLLAFFEPLSRLPFKTAYYFWLALSFFLGVFGVWLVQHQHKDLTIGQRALIFAGLLAFVPFTVDALVGGQTSSLGILVFAFTYAFIKQKRDFLAGIALGFGLYKPPLFLVFGIFMLLEKKWKVIEGAIVGALTLILATILIWGIQPLTSWINAISNYHYGATILGMPFPTDLGTGLLAFLSSISTPQTYTTWILFISICIATILSLIIIKQRTPQTDLTTGFFLSSIISFSLLFSVQMVKYDIAILIIPLTIVACQLLTHAVSSAYLTYLSSACLFLHFQLTSFTIFNVTIKPSFLSLLLFCLSLAWLYIRSGHYLPANMSTIQTRFLQ